MCLFGGGRISSRDKLYFTYNDTKSYTGRETALCTWAMLFIVLSAQLVVVVVVVVVL